MINEDGIEFLNKFSLKRKKELLREDLDEMQKEFIDKKEKCNVKVKKEKIKEKEETKEVSAKIKKIRGIKKTRDVITLNIPLNLGNNNNNNSKQKESLFALNFEKEVKNNKFNILNKKTGLPETFKLENLNDDLKENNKEIKEENDISENNIIKNNFDENSEYGKINSENLNLIKKMSKKELLENQKEIYQKIPTKLIEKMKKGYFRKQLEKEFGKVNQNLNNNNINPNQNNNNNEKNTEKKINQNIEIKELNEKIKDNNSKKMNKKEEIMFSYKGEVKKISINENKEEKENNKIDFTHLTFNELELNSKFFSISEIYNLLASSNVIHISLGIKILYNIIEKKIYKQYYDFSKELFSFINALYYLIDHKNINIRLTSLKIFVVLLKDFFYEDYKEFKFNCYLIGNYPSFLIFNFDKLNKDLTFAKKSFIQLMKNCKKNFFNNILHNSNDEINEFYSEIIFYLTYINGGLERGEIEKFIQIDEVMNIISKNQKFLKLLIVFSNINEIEQNKDYIIKYITNKFFIKYIFKLRGIDNTIIIKDNPKNLKEKIYEINYLLLDNNELNNISSKNYLDETNYLLLSKILLSKLNYSLNTNNNLESDDFLPMITDDSQLKFFEKIYYQCITKINDKNLNYEEMISIYNFLNVFFIFWNKAFKYPKITSYKTISISLEELIKEFDNMNKILNHIICNLIPILKEEKYIFLYKFESFLSMCLNYIKCFIKNYEKKYEIKNISTFLIKLSELINKGNEYYYNKYIKFIKNIIGRKYQEIKNIFQKEIEINFNEIEEDLNFYLDSNEDLRKSMFYKKIFLLSHNHESLNEIINNNSFLLINSKYFPFDNNFIFQIIYNEKAKESIKINYMIILMLLFYKENFIDNFTQITPLEIAIKFFMSVKLTQFENNKRLSNIFENFILTIVCNSDNINKMHIINSDSNKMTMSNFFSLYDTNIIDTKVFYKLILVLLIYYCNFDSHNRKYINTQIFLKNIELIFYENMSECLKKENEFDFSKEQKEKIILFLMENLSKSDSSLYQTLIISYIKCIKYNSNNLEDTIISEYIKKLIEYFNIQLIDYESFLKDDNTIIKKIKQKFE